MAVFPCSQAGLLTWMLLLPLLLLSSSEVQSECPTPDLPPHSSLKGGGDPADTYPDGGVLLLECITGYEHIPGRIPFIRCLDTSKWSAISTFCREVTCPRPNIQNGRVTTDHQASYPYDSGISFQCNPGYTLVGAAFVKCDANSSWNPPVPSCIKRIPCFRPPLISNGRYDGGTSDEYDAGSVVRYRCDADCSLIGNSTITCTVAANGVDGIWDSPAPECKKVKCHRPNIENGRVENVFQASYTYNSGISFQCNSGYTLVGAAFVKCGANSSWNPPVPSCIKRVAPTPTKPARPPTPAVPPTPPILPMPGTVPPEEDETEGPGGTTPPDDSGSGKTVGIAIGAVIGAIVLAALIFAAVKMGKPNTHPGSSDSYRVVSKKEMALEEKQTKK